MVKWGGGGSKLYKGKDCICFVHCFRTRLPKGIWLKEGMEERVDGQVERYVDGWKGKQVDGKKDEYMDGWTEGREEGGTGEKEGRKIR